jgi:uncharacterized membrane protein YhaH (DUF805 family)
MIEWMLMPLRRYADFNGRSRRKEYWMHVLLIFIGYFVLSIVDFTLGLGGGMYHYGTGPTAMGMGGMFHFGLLTPCDADPDTRGGHPPPPR